MSRPETRRRWITGLALVIVLSAPAAHAQVGLPWIRSPSITIVANGDDPRIPLVRNAIAYWNTALEEIGSAFRLGAVTVVDQPIPEESLQQRSAYIMGVRGGTAPSIASLRGRWSGDLVIFLANTSFVSFAGPFGGSDAGQMVAIRVLDAPPLTLRNVAANVIAHEIGHAIGLGHNTDPQFLMCGRPAACRPGMFESDAPRLFPITAEEQRSLLGMYPRDWKQRPPVQG